MKLKDLQRLQAGSYGRYGIIKTVDDAMKLTANKDVAKKIVKAQGVMSKFKQQQLKSSK